MASNVPITDGQGQSSVAAEQIGNVKYQVIKVVGGETGSTSVLGVNPDRSINVSVLGTISATLTGNPSVSGTVGASVIGWVPTQPSNTSTIGVIQGSVAVAVISGITFPANQSVSGTVGASIIGLAPVTLKASTGNAVVAQTTASDDVGSGISLSTQDFNMVFNGGTWDRMRGNSSVGTLVSTGSSSVIALVQGSVAAIQAGTAITSLVSTVPSSVLVGASIFGQLPAGTAVLGSVATLQGTNPWIVASSLVGGIFPISGSVAATITNTNVNVGGSVVAFQGTTPWLIGSVYGNISGSVASAQIGTTITSLVSTVPSSVIVGASIFGQLPAGTAPLGSVATLQGTNPWIITGSVQGSFSPSGNQSISGAINVSGSVLLGSSNASVISYIQNSVATVIIGGSIAASFTPPANQSVSGTVGSSIIGVAPVTLTANTIPATASILVGVTANTNGSVLTTTGYPAALMQITSGPGASITGALNFEGTMDGTAFVPIQGYNLTTMAISSMATAESDWSFNTMGLQGIRARVSNWSIGSITARAVVSPSDARPFVVANHSVSGALNVSGSVLLGSSNASVIALLQSSSIIAVVASSSILAVPVGSVITVNQSSSILAVPVGSVITVFQAPSIVGTYGEDSAHTSTDKGLFTLAVRNDTLSSVTSADLDYSPITTGPMGETIIANSPITKWVSGTADIRGAATTGGSIAVIAAQGASVFTYITGVQIANMGPASVLVTLSGATSSIIAYSIAPAGGGSNIYYENGIKTNANAAFAASISGIASVLVSAQGFISKT